MNPRTPKKFLQETKNPKKKLKDISNPKAILGKSVTRKSLQNCISDYENKVDNYLKVV